MMMNVNKDSVPIELNITNPPSAQNFMASPHGISTWKDEKTGIKRGVSCLLGKKMKLQLHVLFYASTSFVIIKLHKLV